MVTYHKRISNHASTLPLNHGTLQDGLTIWKHYVSTTRMSIAIRHSSMGTKSKGRIPKETYHLLKSGHVRSDYKLKTYFYWPPNLASWWRSVASSRPQSHMTLETRGLASSTDKLNKLKINLYKIKLNLYIRLTLARKRSQSKILQSKKRS